MGRSIPSRFRRHVGGFLFNFLIPLTVAAIIMSVVTWLLSGLGAPHPWAGIISGAVAMLFTPFFFYKKVTSLKTRAVIDAIYAGVGSSWICLGIYLYQWPYVLSGENVYPLPLAFGLLMLIAFAHEPDTSRQVFKKKAWHHG